MELKFDLDWKTFLALGFGTSAVILAAKVKPENASDSFNHLVGESPKKLISENGHKPVTK